MSALTWVAGGRLRHMRLRNPGGLEAALVAVKQVKGQLWNAVNAGHSAPGKTPLSPGVTSGLPRSSATTSPNPRCCSLISPRAITASFRLLS